jgi:hypothetical protein
MLSGSTVAQAAAVAAQHSGQDVDVVEFATVLLESGLVKAINGVPVEPAPGLAPASSWLEGVRPQTAGPFFSGPAWVGYGLLLAACAAVFLAEPGYWPSYEDIFFYPNPALCLVAVAVTGMVLSGCHEASHWMAGRAAGVAARFRVSRRLYFLVFETDLSQLWSLPRARRFSPFLAGMAFDTVMLAVSLGLRVAAGRGLVSVPPLLLRFLGAVVFLEVIALAWQFLIFLRTDLYAVFVTAAGCRNLYRINALYLKSRLRILRPAEATELDNAHPRDLQVARWFALLYLVGIAGAAWFFVNFFLPATVMLAGWLFLSLTATPVGTADFWQALVIGGLAALRAVSPLMVLVWERLQLLRRPEA